MKLNEVHQGVALAPTPAQPTDPQALLNTEPVSRLVATTLQKSYGSRKVVKDVSLAVKSGEVVGLLGPTAPVKPLRST